MHWLYLLFAFGTLLLAILSNGVGMLAFWLLASLALFIAWARGWFIARVGTDDQSAPMIIDPVELHRLREQAAARRQQASVAPVDADRPPA